MAKLPSVVSSLAPDLRAFINRVREAIDGKDGNRLVSVDELVRTGIASTGPGGTLAPPNTGANATVRTPPAATGLTATGGVYSVFVEWEDPRYFGHSYTEVWGADTDNVGDAVSLGMSPGVNFTDPLSPGTVRYYWVRFVNVKGVIGAYNAIAGTRGETVPEVGHLLEVLNNSITESELFSDLGARIDQIDVGPDALVPRVSSLRGKFTVKIDNNGYVSGFGLASTENNATPFSDFAIRADRFYVASPTGPGITPMIPFKVVTTPQVINGTNVPVGVYIDGAYIQGGSITGSAIVNGTIEGTKLINVSANKITGAALLSTSYIESAGYIAGSQGWKVSGNGVAEFAAASIRGQLTAGQIDTRGLTIKDANGNIIFGSGFPLSYNSLTGTPSFGSLAFQSSVDYGNIGGTKPPANATRNGVFSSPNMPVFGVYEGDFWNDTSQPQAKVWTYLSGAWRLTGTEGASFNSGAGQISGQISNTNISTYIASAAITDAYIGSLSASKIQAGSIAVNQYIRSSNYSAGSAGWNINGNGDAEFNGLTVRSGQVTGALLKAVKISSYSGVYIQTSNGTPISTANGPYYLNGSGPAQYLVGYFTMPAPETAAHKIAAVINVQAIAGGSNKDLAVLLVVGYTAGNVIYGEQIAYNTNSGVFGIATNASGVTNSTYTGSAILAVFVGGNNAAYTIQTIDGILFGVR